jgi:hypothetical protein
VLKSSRPTASEEQLNFVGPHAPHDKAIEAFRVVEKQIKHAIIHSRRDWDKHEIKMWSRASGLSDEELIGFTFTHERSRYDNATHGKRGDGGDLVLVDNAATSYGEVILGKIRIPAIQDGYIHVRYVEPAYLRSIFLSAQYRIHDPPNKVYIRLYAFHVINCYCRARKTSFSTLCSQMKDTRTQMGILSLGMPSNGKVHP